MAIVFTLTGFGMTTLLCLHAVTLRSRAFIFFFTAGISRHVSFLLLG